MDRRGTNAGQAPLRQPRRGYGLVLGSIIVTYVLALLADRSWIMTVLLLAQTGTVWQALRVSRAGVGVRVAAAVLFALALVAAGFNVFAHGRSLTGLTFLAASVLYVVAPMAIVRDIGFHRGVDLRAAAGTPIRAPAAGRVLSAGWSGGYGRQVRLSHGEGLATTFSHMSRIAAAPGSLVQAGEVIGYVGSTGLSTGPHLHYEVYKNGKAVNPMAARMIGESAMGREERHAFNARLRALLTSSGS